MTFMFGKKFSQSFPAYKVHKYKITILLRSWVLERIMVLLTFTQFSIRVGPMKFDVVCLFILVENKIYGKHNQGNLKPLPPPFK
jgi:hypothetical protein